MIEKSHTARLHCAPCTCHGDFFKTRETREIHSRLGYRPGRAEPLVVSPELLHPHHALRQELLPFLVHNRGIAIKFRCSLLDNYHQVDYNYLYPCKDSPALLRLEFL